MPRAATLAAVVLLLTACVALTPTPRRPLQPGSHYVVVEWHHPSVPWLGMTTYDTPTLVEVARGVDPSEVRWVLRHEFLHVLGARWHYEPPNILVPWLVGGDETRPGPDDLWVLSHAEGVWDVHVTGPSLRRAAEWAGAYWNRYARRIVFVVGR